MQATAKGCPDLIWQPGATCHSGAVEQYCAVKQQHRLLWHLKGLPLWQLGSVATLASPAPSGGQPGWWSRARTRLGEAWIPVGGGGCLCAGQIQWHAQFMCRMLRILGLLETEQGPKTGSEVVVVERGPPESCEALCVDLAGGWFCFLHGGNLCRSLPTCLPGTLKQGKAVWESGTSFESWSQPGFPHALLVG